MIFLQNITGYMVGRDYEQRGITKDGAKMIMAVSGSEVPKITVICQRLVRRRQLRHGGRAFDPRFLFMWPQSQISVMGAEQAANVLAEVKIRQLSRDGRSLSAGGNRRDPRADPGGVPPPVKRLLFDVRSCGTTASSTRPIPATRWRWRSASRSMRRSTARITACSGCDREMSAMTHPREREEGDRILRCRDIELAFGGLRALKSVSLDIAKGQIFGLVGPNGSGKTSMVNVITGFYRPQSGSVNLFGEEVVGLKPHRIAARGVARTFQNLALFRGMTVLENILLGRHVHMGASALASLFYWVWALRNEVANRRVVEELIDFMQIQDIRDEPVEVIPLGMQKRVELARALAAEPTLLILDEPMAGMNQEEKEYIARFILDAREERNTTILLIEHHMDVVTALCDHVLVLSYGEKSRKARPSRRLRTRASFRLIWASAPPRGERRRRHEHAAANAACRDVLADDGGRPTGDA